MLSIGRMTKFSNSLFWNIFCKALCVCRLFSQSPADDSGILCDTISTKTLFHLISTLNASFYPDYDFSNTKSGEFSREPSIQVLAHYCHCFSNFVVACMDFIGSQASICASLQRASLVSLHRTFGQEWKWHTHLCGECIVQLLCLPLDAVVLRLLRASNCFRINLQILSQKFTNVWSIADVARHKLWDRTL